MTVLGRETRRTRVLAILARGGVEHAALAQRIDRSVGGLLADMIGEGLVRRIDGEYFLTDAGQQARKAQDAHA